MASRRWVQLGEPKVESASEIGSAAASLWIGSTDARLYHPKTVKRDNIKISRMTPKTSMNEKAAATKKTKRRCPPESNEGGGIAW